MELQQGIFAVKLCELEEEYGRLQSRLRVCQGKNLNEIHDALQNLCDEYKEQDLLLEQRIQGCRMKSVAELAQAQLDYRCQIEHLLHGNLVEEMSGRNPTTLEDRAEASSLFAEYTIDFASQAIRYALVAAMRALELQMRAEEESNQVK